MRIYLVGGAVRDQLLNLPVTDRDWVVVGARPEVLLAQGFEPVGRDFPVFLHPVTHEEYALARTERKTGRGYLGFCVDTHTEVTLEQDLLRRDLTINAMAIAEDGSFIDPYGGQRDCAERWLRPVSPAFAEDPLRVLRLARFAARFAPLGFKIHPEADALVQHLIETDELQTLSRERVAQEIQRALATERPEVFFQQLQRWGAWPALSPSWAAYWQRHEPLLITRLQLVIQAAGSVIERMAVLLYSQNESDLIQQRQELGWSKAALQLAAKLRLAAEFDRSTPLYPEQAIQLLNQLDAWRQPKMALQAVSLLHHLDPHWPDNLLYLAYHAAASLSAQAWVEQGLRGPEVGRALYQARIEACSQVFNKIRVNPRPIEGVAKA